MAYQGNFHVKVVLGEMRKKILFQIFGFIYFLHILIIYHLDTLQLNIWCVECQTLVRAIFGACLSPPSWSGFWREYLKYKHQSLPEMGVHAILLATVSACSVLHNTAVSALSVVQHCSVGP